MASRNKLLNGVEATEEVKESKYKEPLVLYRYDCVDGREFPPEMIEMMKRKKWTEEPPEIEEEADKESKIDLSDDEEE